MWSRSASRACRTYADSFLYNAFGQVKKERFGTNTSLYHNIHYNSRGQAVDIRLSTGAGEWDWNRGALITYFSNQARSAGNAFLNASDNNGNVTMQEHYVPTDDAISTYVITVRDTYEYDYLNRLKQVIGNQRNTAGTYSAIPGQEARNVPFAGSKPESSQVKDTSPFLPSYHFLQLARL